MHALYEYMSTKNHELKASTTYRAPRVDFALISSFSAAGLGELSSRSLRAFFLLSLPLAPFKEEVRFLFPLDV
jgi:hypothetical protein